MGNLAVKDNQDYEVIGGQIYAMARPTMNHVAIMRNITNIFGAFLKGKTCQTYPEPDLFLDDENNFVPDVVILCDKSKRRKNGIYGAPDLVVEILSPSTAKHDLVDKKAVYGKHGVKEYWLVDPFSKKVDVYLNDGNRLEASASYVYMSPGEQIEMNADDLKSLVPSFKTSLYEDLVVKLEDMFEDVE